MVVFSNKQTMLHGVHTVPPLWSAHPFIPAPTPSTHNLVTTISLLLQQCITKTEARHE